MACAVWCMLWSRLSIGNDEIHTVARKAHDVFFFLIVRNHFAVFFDRATQSQRVSGRSICSCSFVAVGAVLRPIETTLLFALFRTDE